MANVHNRLLIFALIAAGMASFCGLIDASLRRSKSMGDLPLSKINVHQQPEWTKQQDDDDDEILSVSSFNEDDDTEQKESPGSESDLEDKELEEYSHK
jgi:hypothetical protein